MGGRRLRPRQRDYARREADRPSGRPPLRRSSHDPSTGRLGEECLNVTQFLSLEVARQLFQTGVRITLTANPTAPSMVFHTSSSWLGTIGVRTRKVANSQVLTGLPTGKTSVIEGKDNVTAEDVGKLCAGGFLDRWKNQNPENRKQWKNGSSG